MSPHADALRDTRRGEQSPGSLPSPLSVRDFRVYWIGQFISLVGMWTQMVAQGWIVTRLTDSTATFGQISFISSVPMLLLTMPAGVLADRIDRRKILICTQFLLAAVAFGYAALVHAGQLRLIHVYLIAVLSGTIIAFDFPAQSAIVPQLVPRELIPKAIGLNQAIFHGSRFLGPALAGILMVVASPAAAFLANGLSYFAVIYSLLIIPSRPKPAGAPPAPGLRAITEGLSYVRRHKTVLVLVSLTALQTVFLMPIFAIFMPMIATRMFHADALGLGIVMGASGLGSVAGSLGMLRVPAHARGRAIVLAAAFASVGAVTISYVHTAPTAALIIVVMSGASSIALGLAATTIQVVVPEKLRGRVMGIYGMTFTALMPPFALIWGYVGDATSLHTLVLALGSAFGLTSLALLFATGIWRMPVAGAATPAELAA
jgi:MFS family permease